MDAMHLSAKHRISEGELEFWNSSADDVDKKFPDAERH